MASPWEKKVLKQGHVTKMITLPIILSASRRTDIPAFFADEFMRHWQNRIFQVPNPFNPLQIELDSTEKIRIINFWTKDGISLLPHLPKLLDEGIGILFLYTLNDYEDESWEKCQRPLAERLETFKRIATMIGKEKIRWRFDPIILTETNADHLLRKAERIANVLEGYTSECIFSFLDIGRYKTVRTRMMRSGREIPVLDDEMKLHFARNLQRICGTYGISLASCSEMTDFSAAHIKRSSCIDGNQIAKLFPEDKIVQDFITAWKGKLKDKNQREECGCIWSKDIGIYGTCRFDCTYCYAKR